ncbi:MAG: hypothetical protein ACR2FG_09545 [Marmoricola sp.]
MELVIMILAPFPIGFAVRQRTPAYIAYVALHSFVFTFQSTSLLREWVGGDTSAFAKSPDTVPWSYAVVNLVIFGIGLGLVELGHRVAARRRTASETAVDLAS